jgi:hypothetical protein
MGISKVKIEKLSLFGERTIGKLRECVKYEHKYDVMAKYIEIRESVRGEFIGSFLDISSSIRGWKIRDYSLGNEMGDGY